MRPHGLAALAILPFLLLSAGCASHARVHEISRTSSLAATPEQKALVIRARRLADNPAARLGAWLDAADAARRKLALDPGNARVRADYNFAVARAIDLAGDGRLVPWGRATEVPSAAFGQWSVELESPLKRLGLDPAAFTFTPADRYRFRGRAATNRVLKDGLGAPVVVTGHDPDRLETDRFAQGAHVHYGLTAVVGFHGRKAVVSFLDPLAQEDVRLDRAKHPLAADFSASILLALADLAPRRWELRAMFRPQDFKGRSRLSRLQPYDPRKIPVLFVHGLSNSPATWAPTIQYLRGHRAIRQHYQVWLFAYPTGFPYPLAAAELRRQLALIRKKHPDQKAVVVLGHSMGGMISRLLVTDSGRRLWDAFFEVPAESIPLSPASRAVLVDSLVFRPVPRVSRVIFAAAPHRGTERAAGFLGRLGSAVIGNPFADDSIYAEANPFTRGAAEHRRRGRLPNSIDLLAPDNYFVSIVDSLPLAAGVPCHSLMGDRGRGGTLGRRPAPLSSDGLVPYWSSHMPGARSEKIIPSGHWVHLHPDGMAEIKRILELHAADPGESH